MYKDVDVEGMYAVEHFSSSGSLIFTNVKFAIDLNIDVTPTLSENAAKTALLNSLDPQWDLAWDDQDWESGIQSDMNNSTATWEPTGERMLALDNYRDLHFYIDGDCYRLAYQFDVRVVSPDEYIRYWVDANTGVVFKELPLRDHDVWRPLLIAQEVFKG